MSGVRAAEDTVNAHHTAASGSCQLCDQLFAALAAKIPGLRRSESGRWCGIYQAGRRRFAYVSHFKKLQRVEVWCRGDTRVLVSLAPPQVRPRERMSAGWAEVFQCRFELRTIGEVPAAVALLLKGSYPSS